MNKSILNEAIKFIESYETEISQLEKEINEAYFNASISGNSELYEEVSKLELKRAKYLSDKSKFNRLKEIKNSGEVEDHILKRIIDVLYNEFEANQYNPKLIEQIISLSSKLEEKYSVFRAKINGDEVTDNQIDEFLESTSDNSEAEKYWCASKQIGEEVKEDIIELVKLRNKAANEMGYNNYFEMKLKLSELDLNYLDELFQNLYLQTENKFVELKNKIDEFLADKFQINKNNLMPWHYSNKFFQNGPKLYNVDFDKYYKDQDIEKLAAKYFGGIGLPIEDMLERSDLYEKTGKYQHAYCMDIDRQGDIRVVCNIKQNSRWTGTMLHEFGHAVYDKFISKDLPWTLREPAHIFTTEAIAMLFGRMVSSVGFIEEVTNKSVEGRDEISLASFKSLQLDQLIFARWVMVVFNFEKQLYSNPDSDLNAEWWNLVEKYQLIKKPSNRDNADWASKIHIALYPAYYQNYMMGELLASQLFYFIRNKVIKSKSEAFVGEKMVGEYLTKLFFGYGNLYKWDEFVEKATGEKLNPQYYINQFTSEFGDFKFAASIHCMDGRVQVPTDNYIKENYDVDMVDAITEAGPNKILAENIDEEHLNIINSKINISVNVHMSDYIFIAGHHDCSGNRNTKEIQLGQLEEAKINLLKKFPGKKIIKLWLNENFDVEEVE